MTNILNTKWDVYYTTMEQSPLQKAKTKYYYKNKENISATYKSYYEQNKEEILRKKMERYSRNQSQRTANEFAQLLAEWIMC